jgi:hypothetical protein
MGYILALVIVLAFVAAVFLLRGSGGPRVRQGQLPSDHPLERTEPAADEPTPGASSITKPSRIQRAQDRVPPA